MQLALVAAWTMHFVVRGIALPHVIEMEIATLGESIERRAVAIDRSVGVDIGVGRAHCDLEVRVPVVDGSRVDLRVGRRLRRLC